MNIKEAAINFERAPFSIEKHTNWIAEAKSKAMRNWRSATLRGLMLLTSLTFVQKEAESFGKDMTYDFKSALGYGLYLRDKMDISEIHEDYEPDEV